MVHILVLTVLFIATFIAIIPLQRLVQRRVTSFKAEIVSSLQNATGTRITYSGIAPSVFRYLEVRNLRLFSGEIRNNELLHINQLRIYYRLFAVLRGDFPRAVREVSIEDSEIIVDAERDTELIAIASSANQGGELSIPDIIVSGKNLTLGYSAGGFNFSGTKVFFTFDSRQEEVSVQFDGNLQFEVGDEGDQTFSVSAKNRLRGTVKKDGSWADLRIRLDELDAGEIEIGRLSLSAVFDQQKWTVRKVQDKIALDVTAVIAPKDRDISLTFNADQFTPDSLITFGEASVLRAYSTIGVTGYGGMEFSLDDSSLFYHGDLSIIVPQTIFGTDIAARAIARGDLTNVTFDDLTVNTTYGSANFVGNLDLVSFLPQGSFVAYDITYESIVGASVRFDTTVAGDVIGFEDMEIGIGDALLDGFAVSVLRGAGNEFEFALEWSESTYSAGSISLDGSLTLGDSRFLDLSATITGTEIIPIAALVPINITIPAYLGNPSVSGTGFLSTDFERFSFALPDVVIRDTDNSVDYSIALSGNQESIDVSSFVIPIGGDQAAGSMNIAFDDGGGISFGASVDFREIRYPLQGLFEPEKGILVRGSYDLLAGVSFENALTRFSVSAQDLPVMTPDGQLLVDIDAEGTYISLDEWQALFRDSAISGLQLIEGLDSEIRLTGNVTPNGADISDLRYIDAISEISGSASAFFSFEEIISIDGNFEGSSDQESYEAAFSITDDVIVLTSVSKIVLLAGSQTSHLMVFFRELRQWTAPLMIQLSCCR